MVLQVKVSTNSRTSGMSTKPEPRSRTIGFRTMPPQCLDYFQKSTVGWLYQIAFQFIGNCTCGFFFHLLFHYIMHAYILDIIIIYMYIRTVYLLNRKGETSCPGIATAAVSTYFALLYVIDPLWMHSDIIEDDILTQVYINNKYIK